MTRRRAAVLVAILAAAMVAEVVAGLWCDHLTRAAGGSDHNGFGDGVWILFLGLLPAVVVGGVIAVTQPRNPIGWLFLALGVSLLGTGPIDGYANYANVAAPDSPGARHAALLADREWVPWLVLPALILYLTPTGRFLTPRWRAMGWAMIGAAALLTVLGVLDDQPLDAPYDAVRSPFAVPALAPVIGPLQLASVVVLGAGIIASAASLVVRYRRSRDDDRRQLLWLMVVVVPAPLFVALAFGGSMTDHVLLTFIGTAGFVTLIPLAAGLSVLRFRLYDVERIVASTITWVMLTTILVATYALVVWLGARAVPSGHLSPAVAATIGAVAAAALAFPLRHWLQDQADRRFNRRAYDARRVIGTALAGEDAGINVEALLREALDDPGLSIAYPGPDGTWSQPTRGGPHVDVDRHGRVVARIDFDPDRTDAGTVQHAARLAAAELDNTRLRAELVRQVEEIAALASWLASAENS
ncbi:MAG TPA: hypothetical protein PLZ93_10655, partial [Nocardioides sp.]|nr:hypothetical protein [Nocardioides sp.]